MWVLTKHCRSLRQKYPIDSSLKQFLFFVGLSENLGFEMSKRPKQKALRDGTNVNSLSLPDHFRIHWLFTALHFLTPRLWDAQNREDQSRQIILLQATGYLRTSNCNRLRKCLVAIIIRLSPVKSVKVPRSICGKHNFITVSVYQ